MNGEKDAQPAPEPPPRPEPQPTPPKPPEPPPDLRAAEEPAPAPPPKPEPPPPPKEEPPHAAAEARPAAAAEGRSRTRRSRPSGQKRSRSRRSRSRTRSPRRSSGRRASRAEAGPRLRSERHRQADRPAEAADDLDRLDRRGERHAAGPSPSRRAAHVGVDGLGARRLADGELPQLLDAAAGHARRRRLRRADQGRLQSRRHRCRHARFSSIRRPIPPGGRMPRARCARSGNAIRCTFPRSTRPISRSGRSRPSTSIRAKPKAEPAAKAEDETRS